MKKTIRILMISALTFLLVLSVFADNDITEIIEAQVEKAVSSVTVYEPDEYFDKKGSILYDDISQQMSLTVEDGENKKLYSVILESDVDYYTPYSYDWEYDDDEEMLIQEIEGDSTEVYLPEGYVLVRLVSEGRSDIYGAIEEKYTEYPVIQDEKEEETASEEETTEETEDGIVYLSDEQIDEYKESQQRDNKASVLLILLASLVIIVVVELWILIRYKQKAENIAVEYIQTRYKVEESRAELSKAKAKIESMQIELDKKEERLHSIQDELRAERKESMEEDEPQKEEPVKRRNVDMMDYGTWAL